MNKINLLASLLILIISGCRPKETTVHLNNDTINKHRVVELLDSLEGAIIFEIQEKNRAMDRKGWVNLTPTENALYNYNLFVVQLVADKKLEYSLKIVDELYKP